MQNFRRCQIYYDTGSNLAWISHLQCGYDRSGLIQSRSGVHCIETALNNYKSITFSRSKTSYFCDRAMLAEGFFIPCPCNDHCLAIMQCGVIVQLICVDHILDTKINMHNTLMHKRVVTQHALEHYEICMASVLHVTFWEKF